MRGRWLGSLFGLVLLLGAVGCSSEGSGSDPTDSGSAATPDSGGQAPDTGPQGNGCLACLAVGQAFRFEELLVVEPANPPGLREFLNGIWRPDVRAYRLNILLVVDEIREEADGTRRVTLTAGSGWHDLTREQVLPVGGATATPTAFHFVEGSTSQFVVRVDQHCRFQTEGAADLLFHPGPLDWGLICSAGDPALGMPADSIPISGLQASGQFSQDCRQITQGVLRGCIERVAACQICSFISAPNYEDWDRNPDPQKAGTNCTSSYCHRWCSWRWANFEEFVSGIKVPLTCGGDPPDGYTIAGDWQAGQVVMAPK